ncbi:DUF421 domain-containing protein [Paracoccus litorisediminis]|uniref:DUF421 domain-containing protein n=1 Tax=Paracoccus litorisediminis TaxID=2006130 RepID=A0A844HRS9_9RHOB|nr:YetF domain-containing protein [Paracoccus litorisediminis]MTH61869.1 DUF421 domain-containing protein [Paracoccus litorisediminis]
MDSVIRGVTIYAILLLITRLSGRRTLAQSTPFDFVLLLIIAETTQQALLGDDFSLVNALILILTLFSVDILLSYVKRNSRHVALWLDGAPTVLLSGGKIDEHAMRRARMGIGDILEAARQQQGLRSLDEIEAAVLEISGGISIIPKAKDKG